MRTKKAIMLLHQQSKALPVINRDTAGGNRAIGFAERLGLRV